MLGNAGDFSRSSSLPFSVRTPSWFFGAGADRDPWQLMQETLRLQI